MRSACVVAQCCLFFLFVFAAALRNHDVVGDSHPTNTARAGNSVVIRASRYRSLVVVSTLDGQISGLDASAGKGKGRVVWTIPSASGPLFSSSLTNVEFKDDSGPYRLVPALDGNLYSWREGKLQAVPSDLDGLFGHWSKLHDGNSYVGSSDRLSYGIDPDTGELHYLCSAQGCKLQNPEEGTDTPIARTDVLVIKRSQQTVRAVNKRQGFERWNVSVGQVELSLEEGDELNEDWEFCDGQDAVQDWQLQLSAGDGLVYAYNKGNANFLWSHQFSSPIANVWTLKGTCLLPWDMFQESKSLSTLHTPATEPSPALFLGMHRNQLYVQPSPSISTAMRSWVQSQSRGTADSVATKLLADQKSRPAELLSLSPRMANTDTALATTLDTSGDGPHFQLSVERRPQSPNPAGGSAGTGQTLSQSTDLIVLEPMGPGFYYYMTLPLQPCGANSNEKFCFPDRDRSKDNTTAPRPYEVDTSLWPHLPLISALMVASAVVALVLYRWYLKRKNVRAAEKLKLKISSEQESEPASGKEDSTPEMPSPSEKVQQEYQSRFETDFEKIKELGRGGFGTVFKVRQLLDSQHYAVKRVILREGEEMDSKVMREVTALARLEHQNIVRYFNSWTEVKAAGHDPDEDSDEEEEDEEGSTDEESNSELSDAVGSLRSGSMSLLQGQRYNSSLGYSDESSGGIHFGNSTYASESSGGIHFDDGSQSESKPVVSLSPANSASAAPCPPSSLDLRLKKSWSVPSGEETPMDGQGSTLAEGKKTRFFTSSSDSETSSAGGDTSDESQCRTGRKRNDTLSLDEERSMGSSAPVRFTVSPSPSVEDVKGNHTASDVSGSLAGGELGSMSKTQASVSSQYSSYRSSTGKSGTSKRSKRTRRNRRVSPGSMSVHGDGPRVYLYIQMQLCQETDLKAWLAHHVENRSPKEAMKIFLQILHAVAYVHTHSLMHRDLKPSNVFFSHDGRVKVGDFGLATASGNNRNVSQENLHALASRFDDDGEMEEDHTGQVGTEIYMSPELVKGHKYSNKVDIFSLGVMFFELLWPFSTQSERVQVLLRVRKHRFPNTFGKEEADVIRQLLAVEPSERPGAREIRKHDLFKEIVAQEVAEGGW